MTPLGRCLVFHFKYWNEMAQLYWKNGVLEGLEDAEGTAEMVRQVGNESKSEAARFLESCAQVLEEHFGKVARCQRKSSKGIVERNWSVHLHVWSRVRPQTPRVLAGVDISRDEKAEIIPWIRCRGKMPAEERMADYLKDRFKARSFEAGLPPGTIALDQIPILEKADGFDVDASSLIERVRQSFSCIGKNDCDFFYHLKV